MTIRVRVNPYREAKLPHLCPHHSVFVIKLVVFIVVGGGDNVGRFGGILGIVFCCW